MQKNLYMALVSLILVFFSLNSKAGSKGQAWAGVGVFAQKSDPRQAFFERNLDTKTLPGVFVQARGYLTNWLVGDLSLHFSRVEFYRNGAANTVIREEVDRFHIPVLFRYPFWRFLSAGFGFYGSYRMGSVETNPIYPEDDRTSANDFGEHGLEASMSLSVPLLETGFWLHLDYRHSFSLTPRDGEIRSWNKYLLSLQKQL